MKIVILEPGAWGTALGIILSRKNKVSFWYKDKNLGRKIFQARENEKLPEIKIPRKIFISSDLEKIIQSVELIIVASPSFNLRKTLLELKGFKELPPILGIAKGIEKETLKLPSQIIKEVLPGTTYVHLSGPGFAREVIRGKKTEEVITSVDRNLLKRSMKFASSGLPSSFAPRSLRSLEQLKELFQNKNLKISTTTDLIGVQLAGAIKNSLAIGISLVEAARFNPENKESRAVLIALGLREMMIIGKAMKAKEKTFSGPAGLGDLILTSTDPLSRNFQFGKNLYLDAKKMRKDIKNKKITVEGFDTVFALHEIGKKYKLNLPMVDEIYKLIYKNISPIKTVKNLISLTKEACESG